MIPVSESVAESVAGSESVPVAVPVAVTEAVPVSDAATANGAPLPPAVTSIPHVLGAWLSFRREKVPGTAPIAPQQERTGAPND